MLTVNDLSKKYGVCRATIFNWRRLGILPQPVTLGRQTVRWREEDISAHDDWILRRADLRAAGADPEQATEPRYSLANATDQHQIGREIEATRNEPEPRDMTSDIDKIRTRIKTLKAQAVGLCVAAGKPIPDELISAEVK
jgi:predicted DNA-binding transcriptional regulator AlpA